MLNSNSGSSVEDISLPDIASLHIQPPEVESDLGDNNDLLNKWFDTNLSPDKVSEIESVSAHSTYQSHSPHLSSIPKSPKNHHLNISGEIISDDSPVQSQSDGVDKMEISERQRERYEALPFNEMPVINLLNSSRNFVRTDHMIADIKRLGIQDFAFNQLNARRTFIETTNSVDFEAIKNYLDGAKVQYFTYTPKKDKFKSFVMLGLAAGTHLADVEQDLLQGQTNKLRIMNIVEYKDYPKRKTMKQVQPFIVQIDMKSSQKELFNVRHVLGRTVTWELFNRQKVLQCHRCQRIGHISANCRMDFRCVKCGQTHGNGPCFLEDRCAPKFLYCALCCQVGHTSTYRGCPRFRVVERLQTVNKMLHMRSVRLDARRRKREEKRRKEQEEANDRRREIDVRTYSAVDENEQILHYLKTGKML